MLSSITPSTWARISVLAAVACAKPYAAGEGQPEGLSARIRPDVFIEYGEDIDVMVGLRATRYRERTEYIPVEIAVANHGTTAFALARTAITLTDSSGVDHVAVDPRELLQSYSFLDMDRDAFSDLAALAASTFGISTRHPSKLSPTREIKPSSRFVLNVVQDTVLIPRFGHIVDFVYFPRPATGVRGQTFGITLQSTELPEPMRVSVLVR